MSWFYGLVTGYLVAGCVVQAIRAWCASTPEDDDRWTS